MLSIATRKKGCSGCNACAESCPKHCIEMILDKKGFFYPKVDAATCIDCGVCVKVCPFEDRNREYNAPLAAYAAWNKDREQYLASSSGGAAHVFSVHIIKQGGVVYGCTSEGMHIRHIRVDTLSDLSKLQGSKYVQSDVRGIFSQVKADLKAGKLVLFIGTPCQVAGLKNYIKWQPEQLYLVDLICHGVPSQQMLHEHINQLYDLKKIEHISFRKGNSYKFTIVGTDFRYEVDCFVEPYRDLYIRGFIDSVIFRNSCYDCPFACRQRVSDVTIGDFWGLGEDILDNYNEPKNGISVILPSTERGEQLVDDVRTSLEIVERSVEEAVLGNGPLHHAARVTIDAYLFNILYPLLSFDTAVNISLFGSKLSRKIKDIVYHLKHAYHG